MKILALDSSGMPASCAVLEDGVLLAEYTVRYKKTHSQTLLPMVDEVSRMLELDLNTLDALAIAGGPGSFTGLRIGSATVKGIGLALNKPIVNVPTLEGLACNVYGRSGIICPMMDARRSEVFGGLYRFEGGRLTVIADQAPLSIADLTVRLNELGEHVVLLGDGSAVYRDKLKELLTVPYEFVPGNLNEQHASSVAVRAAQMFAEGKTETAAEHRPIYLRVSQAERVRAEKEKN